MNNIQTYLTLGGALWTLFGGFAVWSLHKWASAKTKNENVNLFKGWVNEAVNYVEKAFPTATGPEKKAQAVEQVVTSLKQNKMLGKFRDEQIAGAIEAAVNLLPHADSSDATHPATPVETTVTAGNGSSSVTFGTDGMKIKADSFTLNGEPVVNPEPESTDKTVAVMINGVEVGQAPVTTAAAEPVTTGTTVSGSSTLEQTPEQITASVQIPTVAPTKEN